jgi:hypothetical protein
MALKFVARVIADGLRRSPLLTSVGLLFGLWSVWELLSAIAPLVRLIDLAGWTRVLTLLAVGMVRGWRER